MNDINFLDLIPNSMGQVSYRKKKYMSEEQKQKALSEFTKRRFSDYINRLSMNSIGQVEPMNTFSKARSEAHEDIESFLGSEVVTVWIQVGQKESIDNISNIEKNEDFLGWENPHFIDVFKSIR